MVAAHLCLEYQAGLSDSFLSGGYFPLETDYVRNRTYRTDTIVLNGLIYTSNSSAYDRI